MEARTVPGTVTAATPLEVRVDGASTACPAEALNGVTYTVGARVQVQDRSPQRPLVTGTLEA